MSTLALKNHFEQEETDEREAKSAGYSFGDEPIPAESGEALSFADNNDDEASELDLREEGVATDAENGRDGQRGRCR